MNGKFGEARYDERQTAVRGRAFKWGYVTLLAGLIVYCITDGIWSWCVPLTGCAAAMSFSLIVVCCICIDGDAYWWMDAGRAGQYVVCAVIGLANLGLALLAGLEGDLLDGQPVAPRLPETRVGIVVVAPVVRPAVVLVDDDVEDRPGAVVGELHVLVDSDDEVARTVHARVAAHGILPGIVIDGGHRDAPWNA